MTNPVQRPDADGVTAMTRYGIVSLVIGLVVLAAFVYYGFLQDADRMADLMLALGILAQWGAWLFFFLPARRLLAEEAMIAWDPARTPRVLVAAALGEAGWVLVFVAAMIGIFVTGSLETLGYPAEVIVAGMLVGVLMPGAAVLLTVVLAIKGAEHVGR
ncbi:MAG: hypothetical protein AAGD47_16205 [Pseudomonadota bacterium]